MAVRVVTDGTTDLPPHIIRELGITEVPVYLVFGNKSYRDRIDITEDEFYQKLINGPVHPTTSQPTPQDFIDAYTQLAKEADGIISIHISSKLSGTVNAAEQGKKLANVKCPIEIVDSESVSMALGIIVVAAAKMARSGKNLAEVTSETKKMVPNTKLVALFDTLEYLAKGGRIGKAKSLLGSILKVKPLLTLKDGEFVPMGQARNRARGKEKLMEFVQNAQGLENLAVIYSTTPDEAKELADSISKFSKEDITVARLGPALGTHGGPGVLCVALRTKS